jgi:glycine/D-amino acid oxidase-like deaminating enzyme
MEHSHYSFWQLLRRSYLGGTPRSQAWRKAEPKRAYDIIIVGGGGHGLATAYYLARVHGLANIAVLERGGTDGNDSYVQRGSVTALQANAAAAIALVPALRQLKILRSWYDQKNLRLQE